MATSPFHPGFGAPPEVLAGRDDLLERIRLRLDGDNPFHHALYGPRGVGKTVLLRELQNWAENERDWVTVWHACDSKQPTSRILAQRLVERSREIPHVWERFSAAMASRLNVSVEAFVKLSFTPRTNDKIDDDAILSETIEQLGRAAGERRTRVLILVDELQSLDGSDQLVRLSHALQRVETLDLPVHSLHAGLFAPTSPPERGGTFIERMGSSDIGFLDRTASKLAILEPLTRFGITIEPAALDRLVDQSQGYPYFVQLYADNTWEHWHLAGATNPITDDDAQAGIRDSEAQIDRLYSGRFDRLGAAQQQYLIAVAQVVGGGGVAMVSDIEQALSRSQTSTSRTRLALIERHQLLEPSGKRGGLRFVLPQFASWVRDRGTHRVKATTRTPTIRARRPTEPDLDR